MRYGNPARGIAAGVGCGLVRLEGAVIHCAGAKDNIEELQLWIVRACRSLIDNGGRMESFDPDGSGGDCVDWSHAGSGHHDRMLADCACPKCPGTNVHLLLSAERRK